MGKLELGVDSYALGSKAADAVWDEVKATVPPTTVPDEWGGVGAIPDEGVAWLAEVVTAFAAELIQGYIDAGSEREVTMENLGPAIEAHLWSWAVAATRVDQAQVGTEEGKVYDAAGVLVRMYEAAREEKRNA